jgi:tryptophan synthase alpha subunit
MQAMSRLPLKTHPHGHRVAVVVGWRQRRRSHTIAQVADGVVVGSAIG